MAILFMRFSIIRILSNLLLVFLSKNYPTFFYFFNLIYPVFQSFSFISLIFYSVLFCIVLPSSTPNLLSGTWSLPGLAPTRKGHSICIKERSLPSRYCNSKTFMSKAQGSQVHKRNLITAKIRIWTSRSNPGWLQYPFLVNWLVIQNKTGQRNTVVRQCPKSNGPSEYLQNVAQNCISSSQQAMELSPALITYLDTK